MSGNSACSTIFTLMVNAHGKAEFALYGTQSLDTAISELYENIDQAQKGTGNPSEKEKNIQRMLNG